LAGSHAAQHKVNCLASAGAWPAKHEATTRAVAPTERIIRIIKPSLLLQAFRPPALPIRTSPCTQFSPAFSEVAESMFSVFVKLKTFTKHLFCQQTPRALL
jgi:hypothetical protein